MKVVRPGRESKQKRGTPRGQAPRFCLLSLPGFYNRQGLYRSSGQLLHRQEYTFYSLHLQIFKWNISQINIYCNRERC